MAGFSSQQLRTARELISAPQYAGAGPKVQKALAETSIVESGINQHPSERNLDSIGVLQQRPSQGWGTPGQLASVRYQAEQFLKRAVPIAGKYGSAGQLAQAVQRSEFPARYDEHSAEAAQLLAMLGGNSAPHQALSAMGAGAPPVQTEVPGPSAAQSADLVQLMQSLTQPSQGSSLAETPLARPQSSGGPEVAAGSPRVPSPLTPAAAPASGLDAQLALVAKIGEDASPEAPAAEGGISQAGAQTNRGISQSGGGKLGGLLPGNAMLKLGRLDQGQDGQTNPGGPIIANGKGHVVEVKSDPSGFGPSYPVVVFTSGPLAGKGPIYLGHTLAAKKAGDSFNPGEVLSRTGTHGIGNASVPGWFEVGLASAIGQGNQGQGSKIAPYLRAR